MNRNDTRPDAEAIHEKAVEMEIAFANLQVNEGDPYGRLTPQMEAEVDAAEAKFFDYLREHRDVLGGRDHWAVPYRNVERADISAKALEMQSGLSGLREELKTTPAADKDAVWAQLRAADGELERYLTDHQEALRHWPAWRNYYAVGEQPAALADNEPAALSIDDLEFNR
ncbi:hypothetical protein ACFWVM_33960 [Nocardia fluminea]|uniref:hypothetical protein n=1 Tax=Nocardia fluminea TaxID=134984 RepID=UPI00365C8DDE